MPNPIYGVFIIMALKNGAKLKRTNITMIFFDRFEQLAKQPYLYQPVDYIRKGYRRSVCGVDSIYYRIEDNTVEIMNIVGNQDTSEALS